MNLTKDQQQLVRRALSKTSFTAFVTREQREAISELCASIKSEGEPEKFLIAFKGALEDAADDARIPLGSERSAMLSRLVTVFIDELYGREGNAPHRLSFPSKDLGVMF